uniref:Regulatory protein zeste n=1 Tax=Glossina brevipalpis TaxID=37001 RepID=A0A1A9W053_9MUSC
MMIEKMKICKRNTNFSSDDVKLLLSLVAERQNIVGCKRTDRMSSQVNVLLIYPKREIISQLTQVKEDCWKAIEKNFNMKSNVFRSYKELRKKFDNIKSTCKRQTNKDKIFMHGSNGDLSQTTTAPENDSVEEKDVFQDNDLRKCQEEPGNNVDFEKYRIQDSESEDISAPTEREDKPSSDYEYRHDYVSKLKKKKRRIETQDLPQTTSYRKIAYVKATWLQEKAEVEINMLKQEHHIKMRHMEERHKLEMEKYKMELALLKINLDLKKRELDEREQAKAKIESVISDQKVEQNDLDY